VIDNCFFCDPPQKDILKIGTWARILIPERLHVLPEDGGHLIVSPIRHVRNRIMLSENEAKEIWHFSNISAKLLNMLLNVDWYNFQENGNWTVDKPKKSHMHLHIYGRSVDSKNQPYGEALRFPQKSEIDGWNFGEYTEGMRNKLREYAISL